MNGTELLKWLEKNSLPMYMQLPRGVSLRMGNHNVAFCVRYDNIEVIKNFIENSLGLTLLNYNLRSEVFLLNGGKKKVWVKDLSVKTADGIIILIHGVKQDDEGHFYFNKR